MVRSDHQIKENVAMKTGFIAALCLIMIILALAGDLSPARAEPGIAQPDFASIDAYIESQMATYRIPGLALAIIQGDQIVHMRGFGVADPSGRAVTPQTSFIIGSTGKSITASAMMMLVEAGKVDLDAPVQQYLPWFRLADAEASAKITVRMLLNHTSGIPGGAGWASQAYSDVSDDALEEQVRSFHSVKLISVPGTTYEYANANYQVAGMIVQAVSGKSFQAYIQEHIYAPLDMQNSYTSRDEAREHAMAVGYRYWFGFPLAAYNLPYSYRQFPAGWYICSVEDLAHYLIMHMNEGRYGDNTLISAQGISELHRPVLSGYAMGWVVENGIISHNGGMPDYGSGLYFNPVTHYGVVVAFNANTGYFYTPSYVIAPSVLNMLNGGEPYQPVPDAWYGIMLPILVITLSIQAIWLVSSALVVKRWMKREDRRPKNKVGILAWLVLPLLLELALAVYILSTLQANGRTVFVDLVYQPDITWLAVVSMCLAVGWGVIRTIMSLRLLLTRRHLTLASSEA